MNERLQTSALLGTALLLYAPLIFLGYGANVDSIQIAETGRMFMASGSYTPSRYPGFPVHEIPAAVLAHFGGSALSNAGTVVMALLGVYAFIRLHAHYALPHRALLTLALITNPIFWTSATYTIDYVWSLSLLLCGFLLMRHRSYVSAAVVFGLATGSRASSLGFIVALYGYQWLSEQRDRRRIALSGIIVPLMAAFAYAPMLARYGFRRLYFGDWNVFDYLANFAYDNLLFIGPQTIVALLLTLPAVWVSRWKDVRGEWRLLAALCGILIAGYELLFLAAPLQVGYLLPALPALLLLLGILLRRQRRIVVLWLVLSASSAVLTVNVLSARDAVHRADSALRPLLAWSGPTVSGRSTEVSTGFFVRWGYLVTDAAARWSSSRAARPAHR